MAVGFPAKVNYATGDILTASNMNDLAGTLNSVTTSTLSVSAGKNAVINGGMDIWQRGTSISVAASTVAYTADRLSISTAASQASTVSRQATNDTTNLPNIQYCARIQRNSGQTGTGTTYVGNSIETANSIPFIGKAVTVSFYARKGADYSAASNALNLYLWNGTGTDQNVNTGYTGGNVVASVTATLTTTWQRFTFTGTVPTNSTELALQFQNTPVGTAGTNDYYEITGVQIELGSAVTTFSRNASTLQGELAACQRYYWRTTLSAYANASVATGTAISSTAAKTIIPFPVQMRAVSSIDYGSLSVSDLINYTIATTSVTISDSTTTNALVTGNVASGLSQYRAAFLVTGSANTGYIGFNGEL
jgi:hypothetical protein